MDTRDISAQEFMLRDVRVDPGALPAENLEIFRRAVRACDLALGGVDFICRDLFKAFHNQECGINEVNCQPYLNLHVWANPYDPLFAAKFILRRFFRLGR